MKPRNEYVKANIGDRVELSTFEDRFTLTVFEGYKNSQASITISVEKLIQVYEMIERFLEE